MKHLLVVLNFDEVVKGWYVLDLCVGFGWLAYKSRLWTDISDGWADGLMVGQVVDVDIILMGWHIKL